MCILLKRFYTNGGGRKRTIKKKSSYYRYFVLLSILCLSLQITKTKAGEIHLKAIMPTVNDDQKNCNIYPDSLGHCTYMPDRGSPLIDLKEFRIYGYRFIDRADTIAANDTYYFGAIPCSAGDTLSFDLEILDGSMGVIWGLPVDKSGNKACLGASYVFAIPVK